LQKRRSRESREPPNLDFGFVFIRDIRGYRFGWLLSAECWLLVYARSNNSTSLLSALPRICSVAS